MRVLFDECMPRRFRRELVGVEIKTVAEMGWSGKTNGELLRLMLDGGFDVLVTVDQGLPFQQNLSVSSTGIIILRAKSNRYDDLLPLAGPLQQALVTIQPGELMRLSI
jgi:hypothetical protein